MKHETARAIQSVVRLKTSTKFSRMSALVLLAIRPGWHKCSLDAGLPTVTSDIFSGAGLPK